MTIYNNYLRIFLAIQMIQNEGTFSPLYAIRNIKNFLLSLLE